MIQHLFPKFLHDKREYECAVEHWIGHWDAVDCLERKLGGWQQPWLSTCLADGTPVGDGNPIFSAYSPRQEKGIRVIQHEPTTSGIELDYWLDVFGGPLDDPESIRELVIACALSDSASLFTFTLIDSWVRGPIDVTFPEPDYGDLPVIRPVQSPALADRMAG